MSYFWEKKNNVIIALILITVAVCFIFKPIHINMEAVSVYVNIQR